MILQRDVNVQKINILGKYFSANFTFVSICTDILASSFNLMHHLISGRKPCKIQMQIFYLVFFLLALMLIEFKLLSAQRMKTEINSEENARSVYSIHMTAGVVQCMYGNFLPKPNHIHSKCVYVSCYHCSCLHNEQSEGKKMKLNMWKEWHQGTV